MSAPVDREPGNDNAPALVRPSDRLMALLGWLACKAADEAELKRRTDEIFGGNIRPWGGGSALSLTGEELGRFRDSLERIASELRDAGL